MKTWTAWKLHYRAAHIARKRQMLAAGRTGGTANAVTPDDDVITPDTFARLDGYLDNLAAAATTERTTLSQLIENNATLTASITSLTASVASLTTAYTLLAAGNTAEAPAGTRPANRARTTNRGLANKGYCWTHGYRVKVGHDSKTCKHKEEGHQDGATRANASYGRQHSKQRMGQLTGGAGRISSST